MTHSAPLTHIDAASHIGLHGKHLSDEERSILFGHLVGKLSELPESMFTIDESRHIIRACEALFEKKVLSCSIAQEELGRAIYDSGLFETERTDALRTKVDAAVSAFLDERIAAATKTGDAPTRAITDIGDDELDIPHVGGRG